LFQLNLDCHIIPLLSISPKDGSDFLYEVEPFCRTKQSTSFVCLAKQLSKQPPLVSRYK